MTQEEKELLLKDLCARLPYGVKVLVKDSDGREYTLKADYGDLFLLKKVNTNIKPYLCPMSSMTEKEIREFTSLIFISDSTSYGYLKECVLFAIYSAKALDWLNARHFDYRGLIEKGLALEAPKGMYIIK